METLKSFLTLSEAITFCDWLETYRTHVHAIIDHNILTGRYDVLKVN